MCRRQPLARDILPSLNTPASPAGTEPSTPASPAGTEPGRITCRIRYTTLPGPHYPPASPGSTHFPRLNCTALGIFPSSVYGVPKTGMRGFARQPCHAKHLVAGLEPGDVLADGLDDTGDVQSGHGILRRSSSVWRAVPGSWAVAPGHGQPDADIPDHDIGEHERGEHILATCSGIGTTSWVFLRRARTTSPPSFSTWCRHAEDGRLRPDNDGARSRGRPAAGLPSVA